MYLLVRKITFLVILGLLASCASKKGAENTVLSPVKKPKVENSVKVKRLWSRSVGGSFNKDSAGFQITADKGVIFAASQSGNLAAYEANSGKKIWNTKSKKPLSAGINFGLNNVYVANNDGLVLAYDKTSGKKQWQKQLTSEILVSPVEAANIAIVRSQDGKILGLSSDDGEQQWAIQRNLPSLSLRGDTPPTIAGKVALFGLPNGNLLAIDATVGRAIWDIPVSVPTGINELERMRDIAGKPVVNRNTIFVNSFQGEVVSIDGSNRKPQWSKKISSYQQMSEDDKHLFATASDSTLVALNKSNGDIVWQNDQLLRRGISGPTVVGQYVLVFGNDSDMYLLTKDSGQLVGRYSFPGKRVVGNPIVVEDSTSGALRFIALSDNGNLYAFSVAK